MEALRRHSIFVLIPIHNRKATTLKCLSNLYFSHDAGKFRLHTVIIDDGSTDGSAEAIRAQFPEVTILLRQWRPLVDRCHQIGHGNRHAARSRLPHLAQR
jgi:glycosyltransferase involved in cell wall biosynthesis